MMFIALAVAILCASGRDARLARGTSLRSAVANASKHFRLPQVSDVMKDSGDAYRQVNRDHRKIEDFVEAQKEDVKVKLSAQKAAYEALISKQARVNQGIYDHNLKVRTSINATGRYAEKLRRRNAVVETSSNIMRAVLSDLHDKMDSAATFLDRANDDVAGLEEEEANLLWPPAPTRDLDFYLNKTRQELGLVSFLQLQRPQDTQMIMPKLAQALERVREAEKHSLDMLWDMFDDVNQSQAKKYAELVDWGDRLNDEWHSKNTTVKELITAHHTLNATNAKLQQRLLYFKVFQHSVAHLLNTSLDVSERALAGVTP